VKIPQEVIDVEFTDGLTEQLDRYTQVIWPEKMDEFRKQTMGSFEGIGVQIQMENGLLKVVSPLEDTPAYRAGLQAGDYILKIDGHDAKNIDINEAVRQITGPDGTKVVLTIGRPGQPNFEKAIARAKIQVQTVKGWKRANGSGWDWMIDPDSKIGYVRITNFNEDTAEHLQKALIDLNKQGARGLILDLRDNPGGLLNIAVDVCEEFIKRGAIISTRGRDGQPHPPVEASHRGRYQTGPLVVLINSYSASASEIVSGALKDHGRALMIGRRTFGKGVVQNLVRIDEKGDRPNPAVLKVTAARYYLPSGRCLHRTEGATDWGVDPVVDVPMTPRQTRKWLNFRRQTEIIRDRSSDVLDREMNRQLGADLQLDAALLVCRFQALQGDLNLKLAAASDSRPPAGDEKPTEAVAK
jgi:carboxyl-terminal processing protease